MSKKIAVAILVIFALALIGFVAWDFENIGDNLPRLAIVVLGLICTTLKLISQPNANGKSLDTYEKAYSDLIGKAFSDDKKRKKRLLVAMKLYNMNNYKKAEKILKELYEECSSFEERRVTGLFLALNYTDWGYSEKAINQLEKLITCGAANEIVFSNLAMLYIKKGRRELALEYYQEAIRINPDYDTGYNNIAQFYFGEDDFEKAKEYALKALEKNDKRIESSKLLAIIYHIEDDKQNAEKYFRMSLKNGADSKELKNAMDHYKKIAEESDSLYDE